MDQEVGCRLLYNFITAFISLKAVRVNTACPVLQDKIAVLPAATIIQFVDKSLSPSAFLPPAPQSIETVFYLLVIVKSPC